MLNELKIQFIYQFIYRNPFEREHDLDESLKLTYQLPYQGTYIFKLEPLPGSPIKGLIEQEKPEPLPRSVPLCPV